MSCNKQQCQKLCRGAAEIYVDVQPEVLVSGPQSHHLEAPIDLAVEVTPRCRLVKSHCAEQVHDCKTKCSYKLLIDLDVRPQVSCPPRMQCVKEFAFTAATAYKTKCAIKNGCEDGSRREEPAPCRKPCGGRTCGNKGCKGSH